MSVEIALGSLPSYSQPVFPTGRAPSLTVGLPLGRLTLDVGLWTTFEPSLTVGLPLGRWTLDVGLWTTFEPSLTVGLPLGRLTFDLNFRNC